MSGHSKWASIKHKKAAIDAKKGQAYTKVIIELTAAARNGGSNPDMNPALRAAIVKAKEANMPSDNVKMAIKRGAGEIPGIIYESVVYEAYGPAGVAIMVEALTDNKNRAASEIRNILGKKGGNMAGGGSVSWMFTKKGYIIVEKSQAKEDDLLDIVLDAGAEDVKSEDPKVFEIFTQPQSMEAVKAALTAKKIPIQSAEVTMMPSSVIKIGSVNDAKQVLELVEALEDHDDVQQVYANFDIPEDILEQVTA